MDEVVRNSIPFEVEVITDMRQLREGDLMFGPIHGLSGLLVGLGQLVLAIAEPGLIWRQGIKEWFRVRHTGVVVKASSHNFECGPGWARGTGPMLVQAMPGGAEVIELDHTKWNSEYTYLRPNYSLKPNASGVFQNQAVANAAKGYIGTRYDFLTYLCIPLYRRGLRTKRIKRIISDTITMMCSRLADKCLDDAGHHMFTDERLPGNVTPSELYRRAVRMPYVARSDLSHIPA